MDPEPCAGPTLFVATNLQQWEASRAERYGGDVWYRGRCYRELDPTYYAWLDHKIRLARRAAARGDIPKAALKDLESRFAEITAYAADRFGRQPLEAAAGAPDLRDYRPPKIQYWIEDSFSNDPEPSVSRPEGHCYPAEGNWPFHEPVAPGAVAMVDAIHGAAIELGWSEPALYQNRGRLRFPCGPDYGLVCFLGRDRAVAGVHKDAIEIRAPGGHVLRFWRRAQESADTSPVAPVCNPGDRVPGEVRTP